MARPHPPSLNPDIFRLRDDIQAILRAAVGAVDPVTLVRSALARGALESLDPDDSFYLVAAGKAAQAMAHALCDTRGPVAAGVVSGPPWSESPGHGSFAAPHVEVFEGGHPCPDAVSEHAGRRALEIAGATGAGRSLVVLLSGGASAMLAVPAPGVTLDDKAAAARALMAAGTPIDGLNCVRKHLSAIKGGRLALRAGRTVTLAISDVHDPVEDDPAVIGSGPTVADPTTYAEAVRVIRRSGARMPAAVVEWLSRGAAGEIEETPKPGAPGLDQSSYTVIGGRRLAMEGARDRALGMGYLVHVIESATTGEARDAAAAFVERARRAAAGVERPLCVIASGETTVHVQRDGRGGRNQEFALAAVAPLAEAGAVVLASVGTDGVDGPTDAAGAMADSTTASRARAIGVHWQDALARNNAYDFFYRLGDLITWGPTGTNVGDVQVLLMGRNAGGVYGTGFRSPLPGLNPAASRRSAFSRSDRTPERPFSKSCLSAICSWA